MKSHGQKLMFVINIAFAILSIILIVMIFLKAEATATHGQMMPLSATAITGP